MRAISLLLFMMQFSCGPIINNVAFKPDRTDYDTEKRIENQAKMFLFNREKGVFLDACFFESKGSNKLVFYCQGQGGNYSRIVDELNSISNCGVNVFTYNYRGYGRSSGRPTELTNYHDAEFLLQFIVSTLNFSVDNIVVIGRSLGTSVATYIVDNYNVRGVVLIQPLTNGKEYLKHHSLDFLAFLAGNSFDNLSRTRNIRCPLLVIHGTCDRVIPFEMGKRIYDSGMTPKCFVSIPGADHENLDFIGGNVIFEQIREFIYTLW